MGGGIGAEKVAHRDHLRFEEAVFLEEVLPLLSQIKNPIQKRESFDQAMSYFRVEKGELHDRLWRTVKQGHTGGEVEVKREIRRATAARIARMPECV